MTKLEMNVTSGQIKDEKATTGLVHVEDHYDSNTNSFNMNLIAV